MHPTCHAAVFWERPGHRLHRRLGCEADEAVLLPRAAAAAGSTSHGKQRGRLSQRFRQGHRLPPAAAHKLEAVQQAAEVLD